MANVDAAYGFRPVRHLFGGLIRPNKYYIEDGYSTSIFTGDPVKSDVTTRRIVIATVSADAIGVFAGCNYVAADGEIKYSPYWPASTAVLTGTLPECLVYDDPGILFRAQFSAASGVAEIGNTADFVAGTGSAATGVSGYQLNSSAIGQAGLKLYDYVREDDNDPASDNADWLVLWSEHELLTGSYTAITT